MHERIYNTIIEQKLIGKGENVIVGISGGPDSVCLLHALAAVSAKLGFKVYAAHINHMLRGDESEGDQKYVAALCEKMGIELFTKSFDIKRISAEMKISLEEAGREARYSFFDELSNKLYNAKIAVAHNKNDQAETVLMHIFRGTGLDGLTGMDYKRGKIIRPLLDVERKDIEAYCDRNFLSPRTDSSNKDMFYTRNKVRLELIPRAEELLELDIVKAVTRMSNLLSMDSEYINTCAEESYKACRKAWNPCEIELDMESLKSFHPSILSRVIRFALLDIKGNLKGIENVHIESIQKLVSNGRTGTAVQLPGGFRAARSYSMIKIYREKTKKIIYDFDIRIDIPGKTHIMEVDAFIEANIFKNCSEIKLIKNCKQNAFEQLFDYDSLGEGINIRKRRDGDIFYPYGSKGSKKLKEYFIDQKVPREIRNDIPLVAKGPDIVWIVGYKINDKFKVTENTKNILKLKYIKNNI